MPRSGRGPMGLQHVLPLRTSRMFADESIGRLRILQCMHADGHTTAQPDGDLNAKAAMGNVFVQPAGKMA